ncbi:hypothetical protein DQ04_00251100 [Trypanosoma grayi]|uniref:hypothetical protein n=1 Tax=Trypanosoma grayi TaxID=71804 RepID=UPI0004F44FD8|nr:hypothetical protein DQ04_00251100 [Trypanosoma grayi]KEG14934.1 hypothetical protein DQ04_00251100 [Trypanosoma grayi]
MDHRPVPSVENASDHARLVLQPREVKFTDLVPALGKRVVDSPSKSERRGFRPTPQKSHPHAAKGTKNSAVDGPEAESGDEEDRRRGRQRLPDVGGGHVAKPYKIKVPRASKMSLQTENITGRMEISGNAVWAEDYSVAAVNALAVLGNSVTRERRLKEELARTHATKMLAFRSVINVYLSSVKESGKPKLGRRKAAVEVALAQCAVVTQTLVLTIQSYLRSFQSRKITAIRRGIRRSGLDPDAWSAPSVRMPHFTEVSNSEGSTLSETTSSLQELLDEEEISRLKQLYFDYYDCDVYVIPGTRPESGIPPNALLLNSLSAHDPFLPEEDGVIGYTSLSTSSTSIIE